ncbi:hypothetical protein BDV95DRAFT_353718 [Massariosphaeria phaeospora]|uniref:Uncharacterized protein n=1 Tax=Massariosphaeria phaeospora TaxID=100035 RepID=A0A7C8M8N3_9PLEO|nr:hypothetical protein BDV95DRAFT_353718 [Massariosphaeria phaeospora]
MAWVDAIEARIAAGVAKGAQPMWDLDTLLRAAKYPAVLTRYFELQNEGLGRANNAVLGRLGVKPHSIPPCGSRTPAVSAARAQLRQLVMQTSSQFLLMAPNLLQCLRHKPRAVWWANSHSRLLTQDLLHYLWHKPGAVTR